jgi:hypothetical protein
MSGCPPLAQSGHAARTAECLLSGIKRESNWDFNTPLTDVVGMLVNRPPGYDGDRIQAWRVNGWSSTTNALGNANHPYVEWLSADVNFEALFRDPASWLRFWFYEIKCSQMPRFWLRWAFEYLQLFHKVSDGTPGDAQLATYLLEADVVVSADKNFIRITDLVRTYAQFSMAKTKLVGGDERGVTETLKFLRFLGSRDYHGHKRRAVTHQKKEVRLELAEDP